MSAMGSMHALKHWSISMHAVGWIVPDSDTVLRVPAYIPVPFFMMRPKDTWTKKCWEHPWITSHVYEVLLLSSKTS